MIMSRVKYRLKYIRGNISIMYRKLLEKIPSSQIVQCSRHLNETLCLLKMLNDLTCNTSCATILNGTGQFPYNIFKRNICYVVHIKKIESFLPSHELHFKSRVISILNAVLVLPMFGRGFLCSKRCQHLLIWVVALKLSNSISSSYLSSSSS